MADVTISSLSLGTPFGDNTLPYSTGSSTLGVQVSALFQTVYSNIGIATSTPNARLTINGAVSATGAITGNANLTINNINYNKSNIGLVNYQGTQAILASDINNWDNSLRISGNQDLNYPNTVSLYSNNNIRMFVAANGNVKIGADSNPQAKLDVAGTIRATGDVKVDSGYVDTTGTTVTLANNEYIDFPLASGLLIVNAHGPTNGSVSAYLVGGTGVLRLGTSVGTPPYTVTFVNPAPGTAPFYRFTNTFGAAQVYGFCFIKTRPYA
jgi:hypothetical protein